MSRDEFIVEDGALTRCGERGLARKKRVKVLLEAERFLGDSDIPVTMLEASV